MAKQAFLERLELHYRDLIRGAHTAETRDADAADAIRDDARSRDDAKGAALMGRLSRAHRERRERAVQELEQLLRFTRAGLPRFSRRDAVALGALVDVQVEDETSSEERTLFMLPVGAGTELEGPDGGGFVSVVTPSSPVGSALCGCRVGDTAEVTIGGSDREWTVIDLS